MTWPHDIAAPQHTIHYDCEAAMGGALQVQAGLVAEGKTSHLKMETSVMVGPMLDGASPAGIAHQHEHARTLDGIAEGAGLIIVGCVEHADVVHGRFMHEGPAEDEPMRVVVESPAMHLHDGGAWVTDAIIKVLHEGNQFPAEAAV